MTITDTGTSIPVEDESHDDDLNYAIRDYVRTYVLWHGRAKAAETFGVSRHTIWRCLERGRLGKSLPRAVVKAVGDDPVDDIEAAAWAMTASRKLQRRAAANPQPLAETLEDALRLLCAAPLATVRNCPASVGFPPPPCAAGWRKLAGRGWRTRFPTTWTPWVQTPGAATFPRSGASRPPPGPSTAWNASSASTRCPGSGSGCSPNAWTPWPCSTTWPP